MELIWEDIPDSDDTPFITRDVYDKFSLAPTIKELLAIVQSPTVKDEPEDKSKKKSDPPPSTENKSKGSDNIRDNNKSACLDSHDTEGPCSDSKDDLSDTQSATAEDKDSHCHASDLYPEPRVPFPCVSSLTSKDQLIYLRVLTSKQAKKPPQSLQQSLQLRVNSEVSEFMRHLQDVARMCAEDYNYISQGAVQYSEEYLRACLEHVKSYPQLYQIHEMTSLTGGTFRPGLSLTFEKQLLTMGNVEITDHKMLPNNEQLASDYERVSSAHPPAKKAKHTHTGVSSDSNAEKLCGRYEPHVCLTRDALVRLLNNHGPEFSEPWELPVRVKMNPGKGSCQSRTVYVDSPLLKTEMTVRERSHLYHEESMKLSIKKDSSKNVFHIMTEAPATDKQLPAESSQRSLVSFENTGLDFEIDLTDLETFGESTDSPKRLKNKTQPNANVKSREPGTSQPKQKSLKSSGTIVAAKKTKGSQENEEVNSSWTDMEEEPKEKPVETDLSEQKVPQSPAAPRAKRLRQDSVQESEEKAASSGDSEDERLVIDDSPAPTTRTQPETKPQAQTEATPRSPDKPQSSSTEAIPENPRSPSPQRARTRPGPASTPASGSKRVARRSKVAGDCDQLGQILRMQKAMLKPAHSQAQDPAKSELLSPSRAAVTPGHPHPQSLVKHCVSSFLESSDNLDRESFLVAPSGPSSTDNLNTSQQKRLLSEDLMVSAEDEQDYEAPEEGNVLYKLYSLQDVLLMVRSSVPLAHSRRVGSGPGTSTNKIVPVHVLAKMEYQLCYGVECLTKNEACQLWAETLLHSSTVSYIGHINAHTSKVALLRKLPADWKQNASCDFKPSKSLNILHHLLKKITGLEEGRYMLRHKAGEPFVTIFKAADGNLRASRWAYDLQQVHGAVPQPPALGLLPWVPVDPAVVLPYHQKHGRVPCTFPPRDLQHAHKAGSKGPGKAGSKGPGKAGAGEGQGKAGPTQPNSNQATNKKKKNKGKRAKRREKWIQKQIQRAVEKPSQ